MRGFTNMLMYVTNALLAAGLDMSSCTGQQATAAASSATESSGGLFAGLGSLGSMLIPLLLIVVLIVGMIIPQRKRDKKVKEMLNALKPGDRVRTIGGIYGTISSVKDDVVVLTVGPDKVKLVFARGAISQVEETGVENTMEEEVHE